MVFKRFFKKKEKDQVIQEEKKEEIVSVEKPEKEEPKPQVEKQQTEPEVVVEKKEEKPEPKESVEEEPVQKEKKGLFQSLKEKLTKSREGLFGKIKNLFAGRSVIDDELYEELEDLLIQSDIGFDMTLKICENLEKKVKEKGIKDPNEVYKVLEEVLSEFLIREGHDLVIEKGKLNVILVVGVNGVGKTTTIGKMASKLKKEGNKVVIGAADTFRAAAIEQLEEWANRVGCEMIKHSQGSDPGAVVFDTLKAARSRNADVAIIDTAGRLHNKNNLMAELSKINKIIKKDLGDEYYESLLVIDGTTGQNGLTQAQVFNEVTDLTGFVITKMDGTAKGGIIFAISEEVKKPVKFIGVGEGIDDLRHFQPDEFIEAIFE